MRKYGEPRRAGQQYKRRPGVYAILSDGADLLLTHQREPWPEYQLPGGGVDAGESPIAALHREVLEETGWRISGIRRLGVYRRFTYMPEYDLWAEKVCAIYAARPVRRLGPPREDGHSAVWVAAELAPLVLSNDGDSDFVRRYVSGLLPL